MDISNKLESNLGLSLARAYSPNKNSSYQYTLTLPEYLSLGEFLFSTFKKHKFKKVNFNERSYQTNDVHKFIKMIDHAYQHGYLLEQERKKIDEQILRIQPAFVSEDHELAKAIAASLKDLKNRQQQEEEEEAANATVAASLISHRPHQARPLPIQPIHPIIQRRPPQLVCQPVIQDRVIFPIQCSPQLERHVQLISAFPAGRKLIADIQAEGAFSVHVKPVLTDNTPGACWEAVKRTINIDPLELSRSDARLIGYIIFEMCNALQSAQLFKIYELAAKRHIDKETFVRSIEMLEYKNSQLAAKVATEGVQKGLFGEEAIHPSKSSFDSWYQYAKDCGHAKLYEDTYDRILSKI